MLNEDIMHDEETRRLRLKTLSFYDFDEDKSGLLANETPRNSDTLGFEETDTPDIEKSQKQYF